MTEEQENQGFIAELFGKAPAIDEEPEPAAQVVEQDSPPPSNPAQEHTELIIELIRNNR